MGRAKFEVITRQQKNARMSKTLPNIMAVEPYDREIEGTRIGKSAVLRRLCAVHNGHPMISRDARPLVREATPLEWMRLSSLGILAGGEAGALLNGPSSRRNVTKYFGGFLAALF